MRGRRVVVAGAGLAGLNAARVLVSAGVAVTIVEARERVGGRVWTQRDGFADGQYAELGGEFIDEDHREMRNAASQFGLALVRVLRGGFVQRFTGPDGMPHVDRTRGWDALRAAFTPLVDRYTSSRGNPETESIREISSYSVRDWLRHVKAEPSLHARARAGAAPRDAHRQRTRPRARRVR